MSLEYTLPAMHTVPRPWHLCEHMHHGVAGGEIVTVQVHGATDQ